MIVTDLPLASAPRLLESARLLVHVHTEQEYIDAFTQLEDAALKAQFGIMSDAELAVQRAKIAGGFTTYRTALVFFHFALKESRKVIGNCSFHNWYPVHRRSEIGYAIADELNKNKGYMKEVLPLILQYGFEAMNLNRIEAIVGPGNYASQKVVLGAGFRHEALLQQHYYSDGVIGDSIVFRLLEEDWRNNRGNY